MGGTRDWLVLSLKWSRDGAEHLVWYRTNDNGYTADLMRAGRYTQEEAIQRQGQDTMAVPLDAALAHAEHFWVIEAGEAAVRKLKAAAKKATPPEDLSGEMP